MSAAFTPAPWLIEPQGQGAHGHWFQRESDGEYIAMSCKLGNRAEEDANARLIAAAPELYEALQEARETLKIVEKLKPLPSIMKMVDAALAKARGEQ